VGREPADGSALVGSLRGRVAGRVAQPVPASYQLRSAHLSPSAWPVQHGRRQPYRPAPPQPQRPLGRNAFGLRGVEAS
jgi:hypothetical protein